MDSQVRLKHYSWFMDAECVALAEMHEKFGFTLNTERPELTPELMEMMSDRFRFMVEELNEFKTAWEEEDFAEMTDALIDLVTVAKGTAIMLGIRWGIHWDEVVNCNMAKERGVNPSRPDQKEDLIKPEGWTPPNHERILRIFYGKEKT
jgi:predicted HAD superfamily Cof-like phosphohydrolase